MTNPDTKFTAYYAAQEADNAWSAELVRVFGKKAGNARYTPEGRGTPELARLAAARDVAVRASLEEMKRNGTDPVEPTPPPAPTETPAIETETKATKATYIVPETNLATLLEQIAKLNKRCAKLSIPAITVTTEIDHTRHEYKQDDYMGNAVFKWFAEVDLHKVPAKAIATGRVLNMYEVAITGTAPKYDGWRFIATLEPLTAGDAEAINLVMTVPGEKCPTSYMKAEHVGRCDHCNAKRNRKQTFVVQHDNGTFKAVGRQCIKDFLGHTDPQKLAAWAEMLAELGSMASGAEGDEWLGGCSAKPSYDLGFYLSWVAGVVHNKGWVSRSKAKETYGTQATVDLTNWVLNPGKMDDETRREWEELKALCTPTEADKTEAAEALDWALGLDIEALMAAPGGGDNYLANVAALARARVINDKTCGLGGSIIAAFARAREKVRAAAAKLPSSHVGVVGKLDTYRVRCERVIPREGMYGVTFITKLVAWDAEKGGYANDMTWFATTDHGMKEGKFYTVTGAVKAHEEYQGRAQTVVMRVAVKAEIPA